MAFLFICPWALLQCRNPTEKMEVEERELSLEIFLFLAFLL